MSKVIILGSSNAIPTTDHENTHMVVVGEERTVMVDCVSNPILRLEKAGLNFNDLTDLILTHFHPDHVSGVPLLLMDMWLMGRNKPLNIYGLHHTLDRMESLMGSYGWDEWPDFFPVAFYRLPAQEMTNVIDCLDFRIFSSPVRHLLPTIGLRFEFNHTKKIMAYSCDTEPCAQVVRLAEGADMLIHEAAGANSRTLFCCASGGDREPGGGRQTLFDPLSNREICEYRSCCRSSFALPGIREPG